MNIWPIVDLNTTPWREFFKRASTESLQYFTKVSKKILGDLSKSELQPFLMCGTCNLALSALYASQNDLEKERKIEFFEAFGICSLYRFIIQDYMTNIQIYYSNAKPIQSLFF